MAYTKCFQIPDGKTVLPINDDKTLLNCAGIFVGNFDASDARLDPSIYDKVYNSQNAIDYLARCNNLGLFVTSILSKSAIRQILGSNNYAFDTLWTASAAWRQFIWSADKSSNYMLNVKVPVMTGASSPSGQAAANNYVSGYPAWRVFDRDYSTAWRSSTQAAAGATANGWLRYDWGYQDNTQKRKILALDADTQDDRFTFTYLRPRYSDDASTWTEATTPESLNPGAASIFMAWTSVGAHRYWQLNHTMRNGATAQTYCPRMMELQFYGREDV